MKRKSVIYWRDIKEELPRIVSTTNVKLSGLVILLFKDRTFEKGYYFVSVDGGNQSFFFCNENFRTFNGTSPVIGFAYQKDIK